MHAKPDLRVFLKWKIARSGSVIVDDMQIPKPPMLFGLTGLLVVVEMAIGNSWSNQFLRYPANFWESGA